MPHKNPGKRQKWIARRLAAGSGVNRTMMMRELRICRSTAQEDIDHYYRWHNGEVYYDVSRKAHFAVVQTPQLPRELPPRMPIPNSIPKQPPIRGPLPQNPVRIQ